MMDEEPQQERDGGGAAPAPTPKGGAAAAPGELTADLLFRACQSTTQRPKKNENSESFMGRVTHVTLTNKNLTHLSRCIRSCVQMRVLYAYDNYLVKIEHLEACHSLTHLYLQNNELTDTTCLGSLKSLQKLYLDGNRISQVEGLDQLHSLEELHISAQRLPLGTGLEFDPQCLVNMSRTLAVLNAARNGISDVAPLVVLSDLRQANLSGNDLHNDNIEGLESALANMERLTVLDLRDNPICKMKKYRDNIILMSQNLMELDEKPVTGTERQFLLQLHIRKLKREQAQQARFEQQQQQQQHFSQAPMQMVQEMPEPGAMAPSPTPLEASLPEPQLRPPHFRDAADDGEV